STRQARQCEEHVRFHPRNVRAIPVELPSTIVAATRRVRRRALLGSSLGRPKPVLWLALRRFLQRQLRPAVRPRQGGRLDARPRREIVRWRRAAATAQRLLRPPAGSHGGPLALVRDRFAPSAATPPRLRGSARSGARARLRSQASWRAEAILL